MLALGACNAILGNEERTLYQGDASTGGDSGATGGTAGSGGGSGGVAGIDGSAGSGGAQDAAPEGDAPFVFDCDAGLADDGGVGLCPGGAIFVSDTGGSDTNSGCSPCFPKATIGGALSAVAALSGADAGDGGIPPGFRINVCAGDYSETSLVLDVPISLYGGFDCATWQRTSSYGWPSFDKTNETIVRNGDLSKQGDSLRVTGSAVDATVVIDGLTFQGWQASAPVGNSVALAVHAGAAPRIFNNRILGGSSVGAGGGGGSSNIATTGLWLESASPEVFQNEIHGGSGKSADIGSVGVLVRGVGATPRIHDNVIRGGSGVGQDDGSIGLRVRSGPSLTVANGNPITKNEIYSGTGADQSLFGISAGGVSLGGAADLVGNHIIGESPSGGGKLAVGVHVVGESLVARNRIYGGTINGPGNVAGVWMRGNQSARVENNMILSGTAGDDVSGIWIEVNGAQILFNTILVDRTGISKEIAAIFNAQSKKNAVIRGNMLMADPDDNAVGFRSEVCLDDDAIKELHDNVFLNHFTLADFQASGCPGAVTAMPALANPVKAAGGTSSGNVRYKGPGKCAGLTGCLELAACPGTSGSGNGCFSQIFDAWSGNPQADLFAAGWRLKANSVPCPISKGSPTMTVGVDLYGTTRTIDLSRGAHEFDGPCN